MVALADNTPPPTEAVFKFQAKRYDPNTVLLHWHIKSGFFLYQKSIRIIEPPKTERFAEFAPLSLPKAIVKQDAKGRIFEIYREKLSVPARLIGLHPGETLIQITYQGCADDGYCYPPQTARLQLTFDSDLELEKVSCEKQIEVSKTHSSLQDFLSHPFETSFIFTLLIFYVLGLLLSFTPCVLPMIPVLSSVIVGHKKSSSARHAFGLSLAYVLSMSATYAMIGLVIALLGKNMQATLQTPFAIGALSALFIVLALSMFGLFEIRLPTRLQSKLATLSYQQAHGHYINAVVMGCLSTLILSPCVTAPLIGALSYIAETGHIFLGMLALFVLGLGMGTPLLLIGTSLGRILPDKGAWMNQMKGFLGLILIAVAIDLGSRIISAWITMLLWAGLFLFSGLYLGIFNASKTNFSKLKRVFAIILFIHGLCILVGASQGHTNHWKPLSTIKQTTPMTTVHTLDELTPLLKESKAQKKPVLIDFYADWCRSCKVIEETLQTNPQIQAKLALFQVIRVDITEDNAATKALNAQYEVIAPPTLVFITKEGKILKALTHAGEIHINSLLDRLDQTLEYTDEPAF